MKRRKNEAPPVPEWVVTYGDLMSLLLCFFILLASLSELRRDIRYQKVVQSIKEAFGFEGGTGTAPTDYLPDYMTDSVLEQMAERSQQTKRVQDSEVESIVGRHTTVTTIHEGLMFTIGGAVTFDAGSAELKPEAREQLRRVAEVIRGRNNVVEIRGHASGVDNQSSLDYFDLSYRRARAVADFLHEHCSVKRDVLRVTAVGDTEPAQVRVYDEREQAVNRRVQLIMREVMVDEVRPGFDAAPPGAGPSE